VAKKQREGTGLWSQNILPGHTPMTHSSKWALSPKHSKKHTKESYYFNFPQETVLIYCYTFIWWPYSLHSGVCSDFLTFIFPLVLWFEHSPFCLLLGKHLTLS
jgi:hypothetical protein